MTRGADQTRLAGSQLFLKFWLPVILFALMILFLSSLPIQIRRPPIRFHDKIFHFFEYGIYGWLWIRALSVTFQRSNAFILVLATVMICALFGALDELYQFYTPHRIPDFYDVAADASGSFLAAALAVRWIPRTPA